MRAARNRRAGALGPIAALAIAALALAGIGADLPAGAAPAAPSPNVTVTPATGLTNLQAVTVSGSGLTPGDAVSVREDCRGSCHTILAGPVTVGADGRVSASVSTRRYLRDSEAADRNEPIDCAYDTTCSIELTHHDDSDEGFATIASRNLGFSEAVPATPSAMLDAPQPLPPVVVTTVHGHGFAPGGTVYVSHCRGAADRRRSARSLSHVRRARPRHRRWRGQRDPHRRAQSRGALLELRRPGDDVLDPALGQPVAPAAEHVDAPDRVRSHRTGAASADDHRRSHHRPRRRPHGSRPRRFLPAGPRRPAHRVSRDPDLGRTGVQLLGVRRTGRDGPVARRRHVRHDPHAAALPDERRPTRRSGRRLRDRRHVRHRRARGPARPAGAGSAVVRAALR